MSRRIRKLIVTGAAVVSLAGLLLIVALYALQTAWFKNRVREKIVTAIQQSTGGTVELGAFDYDWRTLTADFHRLVVHGTEPVGAPPLFQAGSIRIGLKIISIFKRNIDIASLIVDRPEIHLLIAADGSTNVPSPALGRRSSTQTIGALLNLKVRHFEVNGGVFETEARSVPLNFRAEDVGLLLSYDRRGPHYDANISSRELHVETKRWPSLVAQLDANAQLEKDRVEIRYARIASGNSKVETTGALQHFARPVIDLKVAGRLAAADVAKIDALSALREGDFTVRGGAHYDSSTPFTFSGTIAGRNIAYRSSSRIWKNVDLKSDVVARLEEAKFPRFVLSRGSARLTGQAVLSRYRDLRVNGTLAELSLNDAAALFSIQPLPWSAVASGTLHAQLALIPRSPNYALQTKLTIAPGPGGILLSGDVDMTYRRAGDVLEFGPSHLSLPNTQLSFSGIFGVTLQTVIDSRNLDDLRPALSFAGFRSSPLFPALLANGTAHFDGAIVGPLRNPQLAGNLTLTHFRAQGQTWDQARSRILLSADGLDFSSATLNRFPLHATAAGHIALENWIPIARGPFRLAAQFRNADIVNLLAPYIALKLPVFGGVSSGAIDVHGSLLDPEGTAQLAIDNVDAYGESLSHIRMAAALGGNQIRITRGSVEAGPAVMSFSGDYRHTPATWRDGDLHIQIDSNGFPLASLAPVRKHEPGLNAQFEIHAQGAAHLASGRIELKNANGTAVLRTITIDNVPYGSVTFDATTRGELLNAGFSGDLRGTRLSGGAQVQLVAGSPAKGELRFDRISLSTLNALLYPSEAERFPLAGFIQGKLSFEGPLQQPANLRATVQIDQVELTSAASTQAPPQAQSANLIFRNVSPIVLEAANGVASIRAFELGGKDTKLTIRGSIPYLRGRPISLGVNGFTDLRFLQLLDPNVQSSGESLVIASVGGTLDNPAVNGTLQLKNGSFLFSNLPNALTAVNGTVKFDRDRAVIQKLTAHTGGGELALGGFVSFAGGPLVYRLEASADNVRVRYAGSISVTASSQLRLTGTSESSILSGTATVSRVVLNQNTDVGTLLASLAAPRESPSNEKDFLTGMQFDVRLESAPNLQLSTELSRDVEADIDLRLRGTPAHPILLGTLAANQGDVRIFGTKYSIRRGDVSFVNPVRIEPVLDLDLETQARGITVDITIAGTLGKLNVNYRSDPPLQPRDIVALLAVGRTPSIGSNLPNAQVTNDISALQAGADTVLGQAISPSSNRLSKLFGITNIKIDPMVQGITNTPQARLTVEQNISRQITVTYVTNLSQTSEQIFRLEWALSPQYSLVAIRDDNGEFGIDIQYRKRFK